MTTPANTVNPSIAFSFWDLAEDGSIPGVSISHCKFMVVAPKATLKEKRKKKICPYNVLIRNKAIMNII